MLVEHKTARPNRRSERRRPAGRPAARRINRDKANGGTKANDDDELRPAGIDLNNFASKNVH